MGLFSFTRNKVKSRIREIIHRSSDRIEKAESDLRDAHSSLAKMQGVPGVENWVENSVASMAAILKELRTNHARFVAEQRKPSPAFPSGISA